MLANIPNRLEKLTCEEIFDRRLVLHMSPAYNIRWKSGKYLLSKHRHVGCLSRGFWLVSRHCEVINLIGFTHLKKNPKKPLKYSYISKMVKFLMFLGFLLRWTFPIKFLTSQCLLTNQNRLDRHPTCLCFDNKYFPSFHRIHRLAAYAGLVFDQKFLHKSTTLVY